MLAPSTRNAGLGCDRRFRDKSNGWASLRIVNEMLPIDAGNKISRGTGGRLRFA
jgi:hypothetical protein